MFTYSITQTVHKIGKFHIAFRHAMMAEKCTKKCDEHAKLLFFSAFCFFANLVAVAAVIA